MKRATGLLSALAGAGAPSTGARLRPLSATRPGAALASSSALLLAPPPPRARCRPALGGAGAPARGLKTINDDVVPANADAARRKAASHPYLTGSKKYMPGFSFPAPRKLEQIIKYALLEREPPARIRQVWQEFHDPRVDCVATVWSAEEYAGIRERKRRCPRFVYPVLKGDGAFFVLLAEWQDDYCIFTFLDDYKRNPSAAEPYMSVALFPDFLARKSLVLVRGDFSGHLTKADAVHLLNCMRHMYFVDPRAVESFNLAPSSFDFNALLRDFPKPETFRPREAVVDRDDAA